MQSLRRSASLLIFFSLALISIPFPDIPYEVGLSNYSQCDSIDTLDLGLQTKFTLYETATILLLVAFIGIRFSSIPAFISLAQSNRASPVRYK